MALISSSFGFYGIAHNTCKFPREHVDFSEMLKSNPVSRITGLVAMDARRTAHIKHGERGLGYHMCLIR